MKPIKLSMSLMSKLGSIAVHAEEFLDAKEGHPVDLEVIRALLADDEVSEWLGSMSEMGMVPVKRNG